MIKHKLTIFTPTYNRAHTLPQLYDSLIRQNNINFEWLIIDDGSTDDTKDLIEKWTNENKISIKYIYQKNQGVHSAHNIAYENIKTEWNTFIDSDDYMPDNAVALILKNTENLDPKFSGLVGLDIDKKGKIIGTKIPEDILECTLTDLYQKYGVKGDKKLIYRTEIIKKYLPYPVFIGEKFVPPGYLYSLIDQDYLLKPIHEAFVIVEYQKDGFTKNMLQLYRNNPRGFAVNRISKIELTKSFKIRFKNAIHLVSCSVFAKDLDLLKQTRKPFLMLMVSPFGVLLNFYIRSKTTSPKNENTALYQ